MAKTKKMTKKQAEVFYSSLITPGIVASVPQDTDFIYQANTPVLAPFIDLKPDVFEVDNQLNVGSCVSNAVTSVLEHILKENGIGTSLSRLFNYWVSRNIIENRPGQEGTTLRNGVRASKHYGVCQETIWPYDTTKVDIKPSDMAFSMAATKLVTRYELIDLTSSDKNIIIKRIKGALNEGLPVAFSVFLGRQWTTLSGPWQQHVYNFPDTVNNPIIGGHAMVCTGYDDVSQRFLIENSWGSSWGDGGFGGMPYLSLVNSIMEAFVIRGFAGLYEGYENGYNELTATISTTTFITNIASQTLHSFDLGQLSCLVTGGIQPYKIYIWAVRNPITNQFSQFDEYTYAVKFLPSKNSSSVNIRVDDADGGERRYDFYFDCVVFDSSPYGNRVTSQKAIIKISYNDIDLIQKCYLGYYQRAADLGGMNYWLSEVNKPNADLNTIMTSFASSPESQALYGEITSENIAIVIHKMYNSLFDRDPDEGGWLYWIREFNSGKITALNMALALINGAQGTDSQKIIDKVEAANKITFSLV